MEAKRGACASCACARTLFTRLQHGWAGDREWRQGAGEGGGGSTHHTRNPLSWQGFPTRYTQQEGAVGAHPGVHPQSPILTSGATRGSWRLMFLPSMGAVLVDWEGGVAGRYTGPGPIVSARLGLVGMNSSSGSPLQPSPTLGPGKGLRSAGWNERAQPNPQRGGVGRCMGREGGQDASQHKQARLNGTTNPPHPKPGVPHNPGALG